MKKFIAFFFVALLTAGLHAADVTAPAQGDTWCKDEAHAIVWNAGAFAGNKVKLILFDNDNRLEAIAAEAANSGSYSWTPRHELMEGRRYQVLVRTLDDTTRRFSGYFMLKNCGRVAQNDPTRLIEGPKYPQGLTPAGPSASTVDFKVLDIERRAGGEFWAKLGNSGNSAYNGPLTFTVDFGIMADGLITVPVNVPAKGEQWVGLVYYLRNEDLIDRKLVLVYVTADSDKKVGELNEFNNKMEKAFMKDCDFFLDKFVIEPTPTDYSGPYPKDVYMKVRLEAAGEGNLEIAFNSVQQAAPDQRTTFVLDGSGAYEFTVFLGTITQDMLPPPHQSGHNLCPKENALCGEFRAMVSKPCANGGQTHSNKVSFRYD